MRTTPTHFRVFSALLFLAAFALRSSLSAAGNGAPEVAPAAFTQTIHVNVANGNDSWNGSAASFASGSTGPVKTIKKAWALAVAATQANQGARILVAPGTYLEGSVSDATALSLAYPANGKPIALEGAGWTPGTLTNDVIITGATALSGWTAHGDGTWSAPWPHDFGLMDLGQLGATADQNVPEVFRRMERIWVNDQAYLQFTGPTDPNLPLLTASEGAFWVNTTTQTITARPPAGQSLSGATVQAAVRRRLAHWYRPSGDADLPAPILLRNIVFQRTGEYLAFFQNSNQLTVEDCAFRDARHIGLSIGSTATQSTVRRVAVSGAGGTGFGHDGQDHLVEDFTLTRNGRQALVSKFLGWAYGGMKIGHGTDVTYRRWTVTDNFGVGVWFDTACHGVELLDSVITGGNTAAVFIENNNSTTITGLGNAPTVTLRGNVITGHLGTPGLTNGKGVQLAESENVLIENNLIANNDWALNFPGGSRGPQRNIIIKNNLIAASANQPLYFVSYGTEGWNQTGRAFDTFDIVTNDNLYLSPSATAFLDRNQTAVSFASWKTAHSTNSQNYSADRNVDSRSTFTSGSYAGEALVRIEPVANYQPESGVAVSGFRVTRLGGDTALPLTLPITTGGTAQSGRDFVAFPSTVTLLANQTALLIPFTSVLNGLGTGSQTVSLTIGSGSAYLLGQSMAQFILEDLETPTLPRVTLSVIVSTASEQGTMPATVRFTRTGNTSSPLIVPFSLAGVAAGRFLIPGSSLTIPLGAAYADLSLQPIDDPVAQITQAATVSVTSSSTFSADSPASANIFVLDNDIITPGAVANSLPPGSSSSTTAVTLANPSASTQTFTITVPPGDNYTWTDSSQSAGPTYQWIELSGGANGSSQLSEFNDKDDRISLYTTGQIGGPSGGIPIGFSFPFYGTSYTDLRVSSNGVLYFGGQIASAPFTNSALPADGLNNFENRDAGKAIAALAFFWDDLRFRNTGYTTPSSAWVARPDAQTFIIQFQDVRHYSADSNKITCQVVLKATGEIIITYKGIDIPFDLGATIGTQGPGIASVAKFKQISHNSNYVQSGMTVRLRPGVPWLAASTTSLSIPAGTTGSFDLISTATNLPIGDYTGFVTITSNLSNQPEITLPVNLSITDNTPPINPYGLSATAASTSAINLTWTDASSNETSFTLERSTSPTAGFSPIATLAANSASYTDNGLATDTIYYYRIKASNTFGSSSYSANASALTLGALPATLRVRWNFDEASGNALATNSSGAFAAGNGVFSTNTAGVPTRNTSDRPGNTGASLDLSANAANNDHVRAADTSGSLNTLEDFTAMTITFWVKLTAATLAGNERIVSKCAGTGGYELMMSGTPTAARLNLNLNNQSSSAQSSGTVNLTSWTFIAVTWTGGTGVTYYAGSPTGAVTIFGNLAALSNGNPATLTANTAAFQLGGRDGVSGDRTAAGLYDDVRLYGSALTPTEIDIVRQQTTPASPTTPAGLAATPDSSTSIQLAWLDTSANETGFIVERSLTPTTGFIAITTVAANATSYTDGGLSAATRYYYRIRAANADAQSAPSTEADATTHTAYSQWKIDTGLGISALGNADPDGDGINNLLEYAMAGDPNLGTSAPAPVINIHQQGGGFLTLTFTRARADVTYVIQGSDDLSTWTDLATNPGAVSSVSPVTFVDAVDLNVGTPPRRFLRIRVTTQ